MRLTMLSAGFLLALSSGCGSGGSDEAEGSGSERGKSTASASPTTLSTEAAEKSAMAALVPDAAMKKAGFAPKRQRQAGKWNWYQSCDKQLPSNAQIIRGGQAQWGDGKRTVNQVVDVYAEGGAADAVAELADEVTCQTYLLPDGNEARNVEVLELPELKGADAQFGWCEEIKDVSRCQSAVAVGDTLSYFWALSDPISDTQETLGALTALATGRLLAQQG